MNWSKAKTILIIALIATNLFLVFTYGFKDSDNSLRTNEEALMTILLDRGIVIDTEIPKAHKDLPIFQGEYANYSEERAEQLMAQERSVATEDEEEFYLVAQEFIKDMGLWQETMIYNVYDFGNDKKKVVFRNTVNGIPLEASYIKCVFTNGILDDFECKWLNPTEFSQRKIETISAEVALMSLENQSDDSLLNITTIEMVYWIPDTEIDVYQAVSDTAFPTWKFMTDDGQEFFVEAVQR